MEWPAARNRRDDQSMIRCVKQCRVDCWNTCQQIGFASVLDQLSTPSLAIDRSQAQVAVRTFIVR